MPRPDAVLALRGPVRWRRVGEDAVLVVQDAGKVAGLNPTGADVLEAVDGRTTVEGIVDRLAPRWDVPRERLAEDVERILDELLAIGVLEAVPGAEHDPEGGAAR